MGLLDLLLFLQIIDEKISKTVIKTKKSITLEPMQAYERKIIHSKLQNNELVTTKSDITRTENWKKCSN